MRPHPHDQSRSGADERSPSRRPADQPERGGEALVEHLADRAARAERELRQLRASVDVTARGRLLVSRAARRLAEEPSLALPDLVRLFLPALGAWCEVEEITRGECSRELVTIDPDADAWKAERPECASGHLLRVPVSARGCVVGTLSFGRLSDDREYDEADRRMADDAATLVALAHEQRLAQEAAVSADRAKARFLTTMSHELRTPLNAIAGYAQLLDMGFRGPLTDDQRDAVGRILRGQEHLLALVDAVLTFSHLTGGRLALATTPVPVVALLDGVSETYRERFAEAGIGLHVVSCLEGTLASADPERAPEVIHHLLDNALKFTPPGGVATISCEAGAGVVRFVVEDTGRGIPSTQCDQVFEPFVQVENELTRSVDGSGLGLAVARELAERMGGTLTVTSEQDVGSRFVFTLPRLERRLTPRPSIDSPSSPG